MNNMKVCVLSSGSKGNSTYIETDNYKLLIDLGVTCAYVENALKELMVNPKEINAIFITHTHADHTAGLKVFLKKYNPKVYLTYKMYEDLIKLFPLNNYEIIDTDFLIDSLEIGIVKTSHDVSDSNGYIFEYKNKSIVYITDTGYINKKYEKKLKNKNVYIMESNHDIEMIMNGSYPYYLKQRIISDSGHLSNADSSYYLSKLIGESTKTIFLAHLSDDNNNEEIAIKTLKDTLNDNNINFNNIKIAYQKKMTDLVEL